MLSIVPHTFYYLLSDEYQFIVGGTGVFLQGLATS